MEKDITANIKMHTNSNPNKEYSLMYVGTEQESMITEMGEELLTDGDIRSIVYNYKEDDSKKDHLYKSGNIVIGIKDASYVIIQRIMNKKVDFSHVFTCINDEEMLNEIISIAGIKCTNNDNLLTAKQPYVRKMSLK